MYHYMLFKKVLPALLLVAKNFVSDSFDYPEIKLSKFER